jgi:hypothetical protein
MDRPTDSAREEQMEAERKLLAALCQNVLDGRTRAEVMRYLNNHHFVYPDHEVIYRALAAIRIGEPAEIRTALAQAVTRLGFPDVDFDSLFDTPPPTPEDLAALVKELT